MDEKLNCSTNSRGSCQHLRHDDTFAEAADPKLLPLTHFHKILRRYKEFEDLHCSGGTVFNSQINIVYMERLMQIEEHANENVELKLLTYQEWVEALLHINECYLKTIINLDTDVTERVSVAVKHFEEVEKNRQIKELLAQNNPVAQELVKTRNDVQRLLSLIRCAYHHDKWNLKGFNFQTVNPHDIFTSDDIKTIERNPAGSQTNEHTIDCADDSEVD